MKAVVELAVGIGIEEIYYEETLDEGTDPAVIVHLTHTDAEGRAVDWMLQFALVGVDDDGTVRFAAEITDAACRARMDAEEPRCPG